MENLITRTGRVDDWLKSPEKRHPVSCTAFWVDDTIEGPNGIEASWRFVSYALRNAAGVAVHLTGLRPKGTDNGKGLIASGPVSFAKIYSVLNEVLRRGGQYRGGAITLHLDLFHPDILEYIEAPRSELPWCKRCVDLTDSMWREASQEVKDALIAGVARGDIWLNKIKRDDRGKRLLGNVCLEVYLPSRGSCLLQHVNLGACKDELDIASAVSYGMKQLCDLHARTALGDEYLGPHEDRQVGLGFLGLANYLGNQGITYADFGDALERCNNSIYNVDSPADDLAQGFKFALAQGSIIAHEYNMERAYCIAPTATCSYKSRDLWNNACAPEIAPPIGRTVDRDSDTHGVTTVSYGNVEIASEVGWSTYKKVADEFIRMLDNTGLLHGYSFNTFSDCVTYDEDFIEEWLESPQTSMYYSLQVLGDTQDKTDVYAALSDDDLQAEIDSILNQPCSECSQ